VKLEGTLDDAALALGHPEFGHRRGCVIELSGDEALDASSMNTGRRAFRCAFGEFEACSENR
jgi:hypothetical protein